MKNSKLIAIYILILIIFTFNELNEKEFPLPTIKKEKEFISSQNINKILTLNSLNYDTNKSINRVWGIKKIEQKKEIVKIKKEIKKDSIELTNRTICNNKNCFKLIAILEEDKIFKASFYNENFKPKYKNFKEKDSLDKNISISLISKKSVTLLANKKEFNIYQFDINISYYNINKKKPRVVKEKPHKKISPKIMDFLNSFKKHHQKRK